MNRGSALYVGPVSHQRFKPKRHALRYRVFMVLLDLDQLDTVFSGLRWLKRGTTGLMSFRARDHGDRQHNDLAGYVRKQLETAGIAHDGAIRLLCMPRVLGYGFNPISVYFCHDSDGTLTSILYEVRNTFGQRHSYLIATPEPGSDDGARRTRQTAPKRFYVSPFMDMDLTYVFDVSAPGETVSISIQVRDEADLVLHASFHGERRALTDMELLRVWLTHPLLTFKVMAGIHWEAIRIIMRGFRFNGRPPLPASPVTMGTPLPVIDPEQRATTAPSAKHAQQAPAR